ncbi:tetratricopeptide repeat protein 9C [Thalassophryne amazonica]|uniref:tetratricopeptide repeat protein 9C n=1 Tax=Thalassophryne amazonica TaxID=390379 RepID=UPI0014716FE1|nr:tetratricopeptide repeat protein 9C [Thalassophryne amazonica]
MDVVGGEECSGVQEEAAAAQQSFSWAPSVSTDPVWALLQQAIKLKAEGKAFYQDKKIRSSISRYHHALLIIRSLDADVMTYVKQFGPERPALTPEQYELLRNTQVDCYNNLAACLLQKKDVDYARVRDYSLRVLQWRPGDVKALYRAGVATLELGDAETAKKHLTQACREHPNDANVKKHLQRAEEKLSQELEKEKAMYKGMFSSTVKSTSGED